MEPTRDFSKIADVKCVCCCTEILAKEEKYLLEWNSYELGVNASFLILLFQEKFLRDFYAS